MMFYGRWSYGVVLWEIESGGNSAYLILSHSVFILNTNLKVLMVIGLSRPILTIIIIIILDVSAFKCVFFTITHEQNLNQYYLQPNTFRMCYA